MGFLCNAESAIATCDSYNWDKLKKKKKNKQPLIKLRRFSYSELESATNGFSPRSLLGKGSHGAVFRAVLDGGARTVAVKRTTAAVTVMASCTAENEIEILSKIRSRRIVNLIGYAVDSGERKLILVVQYMPNGSLYDLIHKNPKPPGWLNRVRLALQIAKSIQILHGSNPPVIHRDIKSSNVLLDERGSARLSDFGLALRGHVEDERVMSTPPAGTLGYLDPCYLAPGDLSTKSDVFSFGILLFEIISGRRAIDVNYSPPSIVDWALPLIKSGAHQEIYDRRISRPVDPTVSRELAVLAARCVRSTAEKRPSMVKVVDCLKVIYKRVKALPIWNNLRRRVIHVDSSGPLDGFYGSDGEEQVKTFRCLSGRNRKVSNVSSTQNWMDKIGGEVTGGVHRVGRSKSTGSFREIKVGPESGISEINHVIKRRPMKMSLSKSRSLSVLHCSQNVINQCNNINNKISDGNSRKTALDEFPLLVNAASSKAESPE